MYPAEAIWREKRWTGPVTGDCEGGLGDLKRGPRRGGELEVRIRRSEGLERYRSERNVLGAVGILEKIGKESEKAAR